MSAIADKLRSFLHSAAQHAGSQATTDGASGVELTLDELLRLRLNVGKSAGRQKKARRRHRDQPVNGAGRLAGVWILPKCALINPVMMCE